MSAHGLPHNGQPGRNGRSRIHVPAGMGSPQAAPPAYTPQAWMGEAFGALAFYDGELARLARLQSQSPGVIGLIRAFEDGRAVVLEHLGKAYTLGAEHMAARVGAVATAVRDNFHIAFNVPQPASLVVPPSDVAPDVKP